MANTSDDFPEIEKLLPWATPVESEVVSAFLKAGSVAAAAETVGMSTARLRAHLYELKARAARKGYSPEHDMKKTVPDGFHVKGVSTYYRHKPDGTVEVRGQWVKSSKDQDSRLALLLDAVQNLAEPFAKKSPHAPAPRSTDSDLLCIYPMGDPHLGMFAWGAETGQDFDLKIAESNLVDAVDHLVALAPPSREALVVNLGDFFHADNNEKRTMRSGNILDVDTRWAKVLSVGIRTMRRIIDRAMEKHRIVHVVSEIGNHDDYSAITLALCLQQFYANNPRVKVDTSPATFHWHRFGSNLIGITHGHNTKPNDLPNIMACDRKQDWGETTHRYWLTGHIHHDTLKEYAGCRVESFRTLAPNDAWAQASGYRSGQDMKLLVLHREHGEIMRHTVGIQQIWKARKA
jgi:hypothetical protein